METKNNIQFYINFGGFYYSIYSDIIDGILENEVNEGYLTEGEVGNINYTNLHLKVSEHIFDVIEECFNDEFDLFTENGFFTFDGLYSPKYYNYSTDKIEASCSNEVYLTIKNHFANNEDVINYINEASKSCSGFHSFYEGYNEVIKNPAIYLEYLFKWFIFEYYRDEVLESTTENIHEVIYNNI